MAAKVSPKNSKVARKRIEPKREFTEAELDAMANFGPLIDSSQVAELERVCQDFGFSRRVTIAILGRSAEQLSEVSIQDPDTFEVMRGQVESFQTHVKNLSEMCEQAMFRLHVCNVNELMKGDAA